MSADHGNGVDDLAQIALLSMGQPDILDEHQRFLKMLANAVVDIQRRLEQIEGGEKRTEKSTTPTCEPTERG